MQFPSKSTKRTPAAIGLVTLGPAGDEATGTFRA